MKIAGVQEMRNLDRMAVAKFGIIEELLMENAGEATYFTILNEIGIKGKKFVIFCGVGNNGGDGFVIARKLHSNGGLVSLIILGDSSKFKGAAKINYEIAIRLNLPMYDFKAGFAAEDFVNKADCIVDAVFGTGLDREVSGHFKEAIDLMNNSLKEVISVDIPSGISGESGQIMGTAVHADYTVTYGLPKIGNLLYPGFDHCGKLFVTHISFPPELYDSEELKLATNDPVPLPPRVSESHKGSCGKVLFIAGSSNYLGAPYFAAQSFLKAGAGLSFLATSETVAPFVGNKGSEIVFVPLKATGTGSIARDNEAQLLEFSEQVDMVVLGPGVSLNEETQGLMRKLISRLKKPVLIDGDGISALAKDMTILKKRQDTTILTPHPGEMSRICGKSMEQISKNRIGILQQTCRSLNVIIVLKGAHSLIGYPDGRIYINLSGNPGMATAGSGDVLTGSVAAMFGLGLGIEDATRVGVFLHGIAGDLAAQDIGQDGIVAGDIMAYLPKAIKMYRENLDSLNEDFYHSIYRI
jgi:NAD(P)H-hydrate epimerase